MEDIAIKDFEQFCQKNDVNPTNMKADYYLAGHCQGQQYMIDKAVEWLEVHSFEFIELVSLHGVGADCSQVISQFKKAMEEER
ncbi:MAG: hypothetical protein MJZ98_00555 [Paludibacteraceae bacterium]|nr:hypothetical protein [Paludibacteraceae bacterium]